MTRYAPWLAAALFLPWLAWRVALLLSVPLVAWQPVPRVWATLLWVVLVGAGWAYLKARAV